MATTLISRKRTTHVVTADHTAYPVDRDTFEFTAKDHHLEELVDRRRVAKYASPQTPSVISLPAIPSDA